MTLLTVSPAKTDWPAVADTRVVKGITFFNRTYAPYGSWKTVLRNTHYEIAHPYRCLICVLETALVVAQRQESLLEELHMHEIDHLIRTDSCVPFREAIERRGLSFDDAADLGLVRKNSDPNTFYATLAHAWLPYIGSRSY